MALVERRHLGLAEAFGQRDDAGIDHAQRQVSIPVLKLATTAKVGRGWGLDAIRAAHHIIEEDQPRVGRQAPSAPIIQLGQDECGDDQVLSRIGEERGTPTMVGIGSVERRQQRSGVEDQRHLRRGLRRSARR